MSKHRDGCWCDACTINELRGLLRECEPAVYAQHMDTLGTRIAKPTTLLARVRAALGDTNTPANRITGQPERCHHGKTTDEDCDDCDRELNPIIDAMVDAVQPDVVHRPSCASYRPDRSGLMPMPCDCVTTNPTPAAQCTKDGGECGLGGYCDECQRNTDQQPTLPTDGAA